MRSYPTNSPAAIARLIAMAMLADGRLDNREIDWINHHDTAAMVGVDRETLIQVLLDCCRDVITEAEQERVFLLEEARLARLADDLTDPALRKVALSAMLIIAKADGTVSEGEPLRTALSAPSCAAASMPRARPETMHSPCSARACAISRALTRPCAEGLRLPTMAKDCG